MRLYSSASAGSSPRVRGKPLRHRPHPRRRRLIPARAGKTPACCWSRPRAPAHPRACGENRFDTDPLLAADGSSPRVRGKPSSAAAFFAVMGLIPARAGKTARGPVHEPLRKAHPRACGENSYPRDLADRSLGSSPRVRGKPGSTPAPPWTRRLIPARAGKTGPRPQARPQAPAHPRACGENSISSWMASASRGSSPRVRGKPALILQVPYVPGLIPARAGKTQPAPLRRGACAAHPRACGENSEW